MIKIKMDRVQILRNFREKKKKTDFFILREKYMKTALIVAIIVQWNHTIECLKEQEKKTNKHEMSRFETDSFLILT